MNETVKTEIRNKLVLESWKKGMSDTKWQKVAEGIAKRTGSTVEEIYEEYDKQFRELMQGRATK